MKEKTGTRTGALKEGREGRKHQPIMTSTVGKGKEKRGGEASQKKKILH